MRISKSTRIIAEVMGFAQAAFFAFALAMFIERMFWGYCGHYTFAVRCWPLMLCYLGGRFAAPLKRRGPCVFAAIGCCALSLGAIFLLTPMTGFAAWLCWGLTVLPGALMFIIGRRCVPVYPQSIAVASVCVYLFEVVFFAVSFGMDDPASPLCICTMINFLLCLYSANVKGMYDGLHVRDKAGVRVSASMRQGNTLLLTGFIVLTVLVAMTGVVQKVLGFILLKIVQGINSALNFFASLETGAPAPSEEPVSEAAENLAALGTPEMGAGTYLFLGILIALGIFFLIALIVAYSTIAPDLKNRIRRRKKERGEDAEDFFGDEVESIFDMDVVRARGKESLAALRSALSRAPGFADMHTDAERVRFAYRTLLASPDVENARCATPRELGRSVSGQSVPAMTEDYASVRYGDTVPEGAGERAASAVRELGRRKRKK